MGHRFKEATAVERLLLSCKEELSDAWVDALVDNQAVIQAWNHQGCRSVELNHAMKNLFHTTSRLNISLHLHYIASKENPADKPSRRLSTSDSKLSEARGRLYNANLVVKGVILVI